MNCVLIAPEVLDLLRSHTIFRSVLGFQPFITIGHVELALELFILRYCLDQCDDIIVLLLLEAEIDLLNFDIEVDLSFIFFSMLD